MLNEDWDDARARRRSASASACPPARSPPPCSGSEERLEYTLVGDTVNLSQRLQDLARPAGTTVLSERNADALSRMRRCRVDVEPLGAAAGQGAGDAGARVPPATRLGGGSDLIGADID